MRGNNTIMKVDRMEICARIHTRFTASSQVDLLADMRSGLWGVEKIIQGGKYLRNCVPLNFKVYHYFGCPNVRWRFPTRGILTNFFASTPFVIQLTIIRDITREHSRLDKMLPPVTRRGGMLPHRLLSAVIARSVSFKQSTPTAPKQVSPHVS
jgi:hypothetical protein